MVTLFIFAATLFMLLPAECFAWGPATHLEFAGRALESLALLAPLVKKLLSKHADDFLYGSLAADITLGKDLKGYTYNCHNWNVGLDLYHHRAQTPAQKAFMLGYLGHLSADTISHNFFIPYKLIRSWRTKIFKHVYWEMLMDLSVPDKYKEPMHRFKGEDFHEHDQLLQNHLKRTVFSFKTNKKIYKGLLVLQRAQNYKKIALKLANKTTWKILDEDIVNYKRLAGRAVLDFLKNLENSYVLQADPTGKLKMLFAADTVKQLRRASRQKLLTRESETKLLLDIKKQLQCSLFKATTLPGVENYFSPRSLL